jgi:methyl-accepting chemotaxis protein
MLLFVLILFFIILIVYQIFLAYFQHSKIVEGMMDVIPTIAPQFIPTNEMLPNLQFTQVYKQYDKEISHNTFLMAQQNAGNIEYLKQRIDAVQNMDQQIRDLSANVASLSTQVDGLVQSQQQYATQISGGAPPTVTGTD